MKIDFASVSNRCQKLIYKLGLLRIVTKLRIPLRRITCGSSAGKV